MSAASLSDLLSSQLPTGLARHARELLDVQRALERALPAGVASHVRVMQFESGVLSLACASGAVASRLRHQTDALAARLAKQGLKVTQVRVAVKPELVARYAPPVEKAGVPPAALDGLARLNAEIEDGPLKDALGRLLRHHRGR